MKIISNQDADTLVRAIDLLRNADVTSIADLNLRRRTIQILKKLNNKQTIDDTIMATNINDNETRSASQTKQILAYLQSGNSITPLEALNLFGCMRLQARIYDIERETGVRAQRERVKVETKNGSAMVMRYWL